MIFVFGSNTAGRHGAGAAKYAKNKLGAVTGVGKGVTGYCYAIPTKDSNLITLPLSVIDTYVLEFINHADKNPDVNYQVTRIGCGLAGYTDAQMAFLFSAFSERPNLYFDELWKPYLYQNAKFWGTF